MSYCSGVSATSPIVILESQNYSSTLSCESVDMRRNVGHLDTGNLAAHHIVKGFTSKVDLSCSIRQISVAEHTCSIFCEVLVCHSKVMSLISRGMDVDVNCLRVSPGSVLHQPSAWLPDGTMLFPAGLHRYLLKTSPSLLLVHLLHLLPSPPPILLECSPPILVLSQTLPLSLVIFWLSEYL